MDQPSTASTTVKRPSASHALSVTRAVQSLPSLCRVRPVSTRPSERSRASLHRQAPSSLVPTLLHQHALQAPMATESALALLKRRWRATLARLAQSARPIRLYQCHVMKVSTRSETPPSATTAHQATSAKTPAQCPNCVTRVSTREPTPRRALNAQPALPVRRPSNRTRSTAELRKASSRRPSPSSVNLAPSA